MTTDPAKGDTIPVRPCPAQAAVAGTLRQYWHCDLATGHDGQHQAIAANGAVVQRWGPVMRADPAKGDTIRWTEQRNGRKRTYSGTVHAAHPNRWLINLGAGRYYSLGRAEWVASGVVVEPATAARPRLVLVSG